MDGPHHDLTEDDPADDGSIEDQMSKQSFPTSDPPSTWAGSDDVHHEEDPM